MNLAAFPLRHLGLRAQLASLTTDGQKWPRSDQTGVAMGSSDNGSRWIARQKCLRPVSCSPAKVFSHPLCCHAEDGSIVNARPIREPATSNRPASVCTAQRAISACESSGSSMPARCFSSMGELVPLSAANAAWHKPASAVEKA